MTWTPDQSLRNLLATKDHRDQDAVDIRGAISLGYGADRFYKERMGQIDPRSYEFTQLSRSLNQFNGSSGFSDPLKPVNIFAPMNPLFK